MRKVVAPLLCVIGGLAGWAGARSCIRRWTTEWVTGAVSVYGDGASVGDLSVLPNEEVDRILGDY